MQVYKGMVRQGVWPSITTFGTLLTAVSHAGSYETVKQVRQSPCCCICALNTGLTSTDAFFMGSSWTEGFSVHGAECVLSRCGSGSWARASRSPARASMLTSLLWQRG